MIVGIDASRVPTRTRTGTETYSRELITHLLPLLADAGHRVRLYTRSRLEPAMLGVNRWPAHVDVRHLSWPRLWTHLALAAELWRHPPDVLFIPAHVVPLTPPPGLPIVVTVHDLGYEHFPEAHPRAQRWYLRWSTRHNVRRAHRILVDSQATKQDLVHVYQVPADRVTVVYPGYVPPPRPDTDAVRAVRRTYGIESPYLIFIGTLQPRKNLVRLLDAFARVQDVPYMTVTGERQEPVHLVLVGKPGWLPEPILQRAHQPDVHDRVHLLGYLPEAEKLALLAGAVGLVFPSLFEGFGFPVLEAQALGVPVLVSRTSSLPEVAGEAALYVAPESTEDIAAGIRRLLQEPDLRAQLQRRGYTNVKRFSWQRAAETVVRILEDVA